MMSSAASDTVGGAAATTTELSFQALGRQFDLKLEPISVYAQGATITWVDDAGVVEEPADVPGTFFSGRVDGDSGSWVRLSIKDGTLSGIVSTAREMYFLEPAERFLGAAAAGVTLAYRLSDTDSEWKLGSCAARSHKPGLKRGAKKSRAAAHERYASALGDLPEVAGGAAAAVLQRVELGMVADYEYFTRHGSNSEFDIADVINAVDGIYQSELGVKLEILTTVVYTTANDPFGNTTDPSALLTEFSVFKNNNDNSPGQVLHGVDLAHLMTGRDLNSTVIGIAWLSVLCESYYGAGLSSDCWQPGCTSQPSLNMLTLLLAHEMGHNFAAPHDAQSGSQCQSEPSTFIMNPVLSQSLQHRFSPCSKSLINPHVAGASCLDDFNPGPPPPLTLNPLSGPLVVGGPLTLTGTGFTPGSVLVVFLATATGTAAYGPYSPSNRTGTTLGFNQLSPSMPLGNGFATVVVVNTDQNFIQSNPQSQYVYGNASLNIPTITAVNGVALRPLQEGVPLASVETAVPQGSTVTITGTGFNNAVVNLYTPTSAYALTVKPGATSTRIQVDVPPGAPTGPGALQVINNPFTGNVVSNAVSVPIGAPLTLTSVTQSGSVITVRGTGFSPVSVINFFNAQPGGGTANLGGYGASGQPNIPLNVVSDTEFTFTVPTGAYSGSAYVQVINPPYIPFSSSGGDPDGAFTLVVP